jgi:dihydroorotate dehydrogenase electron transfer subunit
MAGVTMKMNILEIEDIVKENEIVKSFYFTDEDISKAEPAQFVMLWIPHVVSGKVDFDVPDQIPMSISSVDKKRFSLTVRKYGLTTGELFKYKTGDKVGMTGPRGRGFNVTGDRVLCVAGGIGVAPLLLLVQKLQKREIHFILGATTKNELLLQEKLENLCTSVCITTDDGSCGQKGFACDPVEDFIDEYTIDQIYCCGPEIMMYKILEISLKKNVPAQFSLERYMYCGLGLCGHCTLDGYLVCKDGPVFTSEELKTVEDFGVKMVDETGRKVRL